MDTARLELLTHIASLYFVDGLSQKEIADQTGYSRSMVSRLLSEARDQQLVEIRIHHPLERCLELEQDLQQRFGLKMARVLSFNAMSHYRSSRPLGILAARIIEDQMHDGITLAVSWGRTILETVEAVRPRALAHVHVAQMVGLLGTADPQIDGYEIARRLARAFAGTYSILPAPLFVEDAVTRDALLNDARIRQALDIARQADVALLGVGTCELEHCTLYHNGYLTAENLHDLVEAGAVGDVCCNFLDANGDSPDEPLGRRVIGIDRASLHAISTKIVVASGVAKIKPILAAIRAGLVDVLVTDEVAATGVLDLELISRPEAPAATTRSTYTRPHTSVRGSQWSTVSGQ